ncbi:MAG: DUF5677 domain-containing protein [Thermodesulfobacteriota bacterium]
MSTENRAHPKLLNREFALQNAQDIIALASPLLTEVVNYATNAYVRCQTSARDPSFGDLPPLMIYLHMIEMTDGIEQLVAGSCSGPIHPLLRTSLEGFISLEYLFKEHYEQRCRQWLVCHISEEINYYERFDTRTSRGHQFRQTLNDQGIKDDLQVDALEQLIGYRGQLDEPELKGIAEVYRRSKQKTWYSLFNGPRNLRELAASVSKLAEYDLLYTQWSKTTHGRSASRYLKELKSGTLAVLNLRDAEWLKDDAVMAASFLAGATRLMIHKFRRGERIQDWLHKLDDIMGPLRALEVRARLVGEDS